MSGRVSEFEGQEQDVAQRAESLRHKIMGGPRGRGVGCRVRLSGRLALTGWPDKEGPPSGLQEGLKGAGGEQGE